MANASFAKKSNVYSKAQADARFLTGSQGAARFLPARGSTSLQVSPESWVSNFNNDPTASVHFAPGLASLSGDSSTAQTFLAGVTLPSILQGRPVKLDSFELCYDAGDSAVIDDVFLDRTEATASGSGAETLIEDTADRADTTCRTYSGASPVELGPTDGIVVGVKTKYPSGANHVNIVRLTLKLST